MGSHFIALLPFHGRWVGLLVKALPKVVISLVTMLIKWFQVLTSMHGGGGS